MAGAVEARLAYGFTDIIRERTGEPLPFPRIAAPVQFDDQVSIAGTPVAPQANRTGTLIL
jgi:hypothetical protein